ncbi:MAG: hypothetical protein F6J98_39320 [Moorea sp. SIO4G2]|nr:MULTISPECIES: hypothetical protein [Moorena]NEO16911.1 hypothetical protein [Moorena sp. SIO3E8]NEO51370.1 hypothetical protein [Moorena sp. SIO4A3]NEO66116.1 hypothetical protein [Moorena sp. SIO4G2]NEQ02418.1 hypothetical protein [Moorena sp. SIO3F7]
MSEVWEVWEVWVVWGGCLCSLLPAPCSLLPAPCSQIRCSLCYISL